MPSLAEDRVKQLAKLKSNTVCPNCGQQKKFGFSTVCIKFLTFVCNECKSSHQAISHRCKSLTMSSWSNDEVEALERGGNLKCRRTWLKNAPPEGQGGRPKPGDDINVHKRFIVEAYEHKRYYGDFDPSDGMGSAATSAPTSGSAASASSRRTAAAPVAAAPVSAPPPRTKRPVVAPAPTPAPPPVVDLLDFADFSSSAPAPPATNSSSQNSYHDPFAADSSSFRQSSAAPVPTNPSASIFDVFGAGSPAPASTTSAPHSSANVDSFAFDAFGSTPAANAGIGNRAPVPAPASDPPSSSFSSDPFAFDAFGSSLPSVSSAPPSSLNDSSKIQSNVTKKPIMGGPSGSAYNGASAISMMGAGVHSGMQLPPSMSGGGNGGTGMNNMNMNMNMNNMNMNMNMRNPNNTNTMMGGMGNNNNNGQQMNPQMMAMMQQQMQMMQQQARGGNNNNMMMTNNNRNNFGMGGNMNSSNMQGNNNMNLMNSDMMSGQQTNSFMNKSSSNHNSNFQGFR